MTHDHAIASKLTRVSAIKPGDKIVMRDDSLATVVEVRGGGGGRWPFRIAIKQANGWSDDLRHHGWESLFVVPA